MCGALEEEWRYKYLGELERLTDLFLFRLLPLIGDGDEELDLEREYFLVIFLLLFRTFLLFFDAADKVLPDVINRKKAINNNSRRGLLCSFAKPHVLTYFSPLLFLKQTPSN